MSKKTTEGHWYEIPIEVRFRDLDAMGYVNNAVTVTSRGGGAPC